MNPITVTTIFDTHPEEVWQALSEESQLKRWYFPVENYKFEEGTDFTFTKALNQRSTGVEKIG